MDEAFGPWMVVERKSRRKLDRNRGSKVKIKGGIWKALDLEL